MPFCRQLQQSGPRSLISILAVLVISTVNIVATPMKGDRGGDKLLFDDEFDGPAGVAPDSQKWSLEIGGGGWGNKELEYYTDSSSNAYLTGSGSLAITALKVESSQPLACWYGPCRYTSARLKTKGKFDLKYGRFEARIKIPTGKGVWPAFWLLGNNIDTVGWPGCGEINIMENIGREPATVHGTVHGPGYSGANGIGSPYTLQNNEAFAANFHVFAAEWSKNQIHWIVDGKPFKTLRQKDLPTGTKWVYDHPFFMILNFAVGGEWPGSPDAQTAFPQTMLIDYVRVYARGH